MKILRWIWVIPLGMFEVCLLFAAIIFATVGIWQMSANHLCLAIIKYADSLPRLRWYKGKD